MNKYKHIIILFIVYVSIGIKGFSQVNDAGMWISLNLEKKVLPGFSLHLSDELRLNENISEAGTHFTEFGGEYRFTRNISGGAYYRFIQKRRVDDSYSKRHRYYVELNYRQKIGKVNIALRERFQSQYNDIFSREKGKIPEDYLRSRLAVKTKIYKATQAFINGEVYYQLSNSQGNELDQLRFSAGLEYNLKRYGGLEAFYMINKEIHVNDPLTEYIIGLGYSYSF